ncbi:MAG: type III pantothenate kinase [Gammaproteobacteria bacterium]|nr:type III pantothenate kinase [Gammaproteobacteria bacterium]
MILAADAGNTRIKWGLHDGGVWLEKGWSNTADSARLSDAWSGISAPGQIVVSNVAGPAVRNQIELACKRWPVEIQWIKATDCQCGVRNGYENFSQLGSDRWAALIAARSMLHEACIVANVGTAMTVDALSSDGVFMGGIIVPGLMAMRSALAESTAAIEVSGGSFKAFPGNTADGVYTGALSAMAGAVERMAEELHRAQGRLPLRVLSGGDAESLLPLLSGNAMMVDNLVLEGLIRIVLA